MKRLEDNRMATTLHWHGIDTALRYRGLPLGESPLSSRTTIATLAPSSAVWWLTPEKAKAAAARSVGSGEEDAKVRP